MTTRDEWQPPTFDPQCTPCIRRHRHDHPGGLRPVWWCLYCDDGFHDKCDVFQFCSCDCGLRDNPTQKENP